MRLAGVALGFAGVAVAIGGGAFAGFGSSVAAEVACVAATLAYALAGVYGRRLRALGIAPLQAATGQLEKASRVKEVRRSIARIKTQQTERARSAAK